MGSLLSGDLKSPRISVLVAVLAGVALCVAVICAVLVPRTAL